MILQSGYECFLTQSADVPASERVFLTETRVLNVDDFLSWREITRREKEMMQVQAAFIDVENINIGSLDRMEGLLGEIQERINDIPLSANESLQKISFFPLWNSFIGHTLPVGFRLQYAGMLYEVIQEHTVQEDWKPTARISSLYKVVEAEHEGTKEDPIPWTQGMELLQGKFYSEKGVIYICLRDSGMSMSYDLANLVAAGYVSTETEMPTDDIEKTEADGTIEFPIAYTQGMTLEKDKYYSQYDITYLCIQSGDSLAYDLKDIGAIAQAVNK